VIRERDIEAKVVKWAKANGWLTYKFVSPSQRGVPDRIFIKDGCIVFVEFKAPGKKPTPLQAQTIRKMKDAGCEVWVCDNAESAIDALAE
jgi:hypothetical protein